MQLQVLMDWCQADEHPAPGPIDKGPGEPVLCVRIGCVPICVYCFNLPVLDALEERKQRRLSSPDPAVRRDEESWELSVLDEYVEHLMEAMDYRSVRHEQRDEVKDALAEAMRIVAR